MEECDSLCEEEANINLMMHMKERLETPHTTFLNKESDFSLIKLYRGHSNTKFASFSTTLLQLKWHNLLSLKIGIVDCHPMSMASL